MMLQMYLLEKPLLDIKHSSFASALPLLLFCQ